MGLGQLSQKKWLLLTVGGLGTVESKEVVTTHCWWAWDSFVERSGYYSLLVGLGQLSRKKWLLLTVSGLGTVESKEVVTTHCWWAWDS